MKHGVFVGTCVIAVLVTSCTLPDPVAYGDKCTGIKAENIVWGITDPCMKDGDRQICDAEAEDVIQLAGGYCPIGFICRYDEDGLPWCVHSCPEGQVFCGEACINPKRMAKICVSIRRQTRCSAVQINGQSEFKCPMFLVSE